MTAIDEELRILTLEQDFRAAMGHVAAAVSVVTTLDDGVPYGSTVSAFGSLSMVPPMMFVSLDNRSTLLSRLQVGSALAVNVLAAEQEEIAQRFARRGQDKFVGLDWSEVDGAAALASRHALVTLSVTQLVPAGDHTVVFADVVAADVTPGAPLTYWHRTFGTHRTD